jgi:hypothetical protein
MWYVKFRMYFAIYYPHSWWKRQLQKDLVLSAEELKKPVKNKRHS